MYCLYESCKMNNLSFGRYIEDILTEKKWGRCIGDIRYIEDILTRMKDVDKYYWAMLPCFYVDKTSEMKECA